MASRRGRKIWALLECVNGGKPITGARREVAGAVRVFNYYAGAMDKFFGDTIPVAENILNFTLREPLGVVAQITPWNFPLLAAALETRPRAGRRLRQPTEAVALDAAVDVDARRDYRRLRRAQGNR